MNLDGKVAVITGGGRGIGKAVALAYARAGAKLAICARTAEEVEKTAAAIRALGADCLALACDVSQEEDVKRFVDEVVGRFGRIDVLINNAGVMTRPASVEEYDVKKWDYTMAVNLRGPFLMAKAALPVMIRGGGGSIINVSSSIGRGAYANFAAYAASKWGLEGLTQTLAAEAAGRKVRVNSVEPGYVATKLTGYHGSAPESVTEVFVFLASEEARNITGKMLSASNWRSEVRQR
ncbi:MAG TPA: SDR family oxidoreductase [Verrucomicrobiae bacterium]|jgi:NAD(P)-dependent dehydrogenase (short-subunit alcohol dehydrogenase family)|nr:SDR family oxidoreductase [Verrucomicrobiae bacterium]